MKDGTVISGEAGGKGVLGVDVAPAGVDSCRTVRKV